MEHLENNDTPKTIRFEINSRRIAKNTIFLYLRMLILLVINLYVARLILNALGEDDYGLYNVVGGIVLLFTVVNGVLTAGTSRFLTFDLGKGDLESLRKTFSAAFTMHCIVALIVFLLSETVGLWFLNTQLVIPNDRIITANWLFQFSIISAMLSLTQVPYSSTIVSHERMDVYAWAGLSEGIFKLIMSLSLVYIEFNDKLIAYGLMILFWNLSLQIFYRYYCMRNFSESKLMLIKDKSVYKKMLSFSMWDLGGALGGVANSQGINFLLNIFFGLVANAARGLAVHVETALQGFANNFTTAVRPQIVKSYASMNYKGFFKLIFESSKYSYFLLLIVTLPLLIECEYVLTLWLINVPNYTVTFIRWIMAVNLFRAMARPVIDGCHATGNIKKLNLYTSSVIILTLPCSWLAFKLGAPPEAVFIIYGANLCINSFVELYVLKLEIDYSIKKYIYEVMLKCLGVTSIVIILPIFIHYIFEPSFIRLCCTTLLTEVSIVFCVIYFILNSEQRNKVYLTVKCRIKKYKR